MKKILATLMMASVMSGVRAQTFTPPSGSVTEFIHPFADLNTTDVTQHLSCYSFSDVLYGGVNNDFFVWAYSGVNTWSNPGTGISWKRTDASGAVQDEGTIPYSQKWDMEVGILRAGSAEEGNIFVIVAYYEPGVGHKYDTYRWNPWGLTYGGTTSLSTTTTHSRISMDSHYLYGIAMTWHDGTDLKVKYLSVGSSGVVDNPTTTVAGGANAKDQDIAFAHPETELKVRIAYIEDVGSSPYNVRVISQSVASIVSGGTVGFAVDDLAPNAIEHSTAKVRMLNLDCPDHYSDKWSYVIQKRSMGFPTTHNIVARIKNTGSGPFNVDLTLDPSPLSLASQVNVYPSVAYGPDGTTINYAWANSNPALTPSPERYVAVKYTDGGAKIGPIDEFKIISPKIGLYPIVTLSKQNDMSSKMFVVYSVENPGILLPYARDIRHKFVDWTTTFFRPEAPTDLEAVPTVVNDAYIYPNPFSSSFKISMPHNTPNEQFSMAIYDITGRMIMSKDGSLDEINGQIETSSLPAGTYTVSIRMKESKYSKSFVVIKQK